MSEYIEQAEQFLNDHDASMTIEFKEQVYNPWGDHSAHDVYDITICRNGYAPYSCTFTQSAMCTDRGEEPTAYDVLACVEKYGYDSYTDFCAELGYPGGEESLYTYLRVMDEYENVERLFGDCMEELREIS